MSENRASDHYQRWYAKNGDAYNEKRRQRYRQDSEYRERMQASARATRRAYLDKLPPGRIRLRYGDDMVLAYRITKAAELVGCKRSQIQRWHKDNTIPDPIFGAPDRAYTGWQIILMKALWQAESAGSELVDRMAQDCWEQWEDHVRDD